jgi:hypothetical protein
MRVQVVGFSTLLFAVSCGGAAGKAIQPTDPSAHEAMKEPSTLQACAPAPGQPLVVDMKSSDRSDLELAMREGLVVVAYNCKELKLLRACSVHGNYAFASVSRKEDVVQLESKDEVQANMPVSGVKLGASLKAGSTLDLALITVGKRRASTRIVNRDELEGDCKEATHIVRGAYIGAFAMGTGTLGHAKAVAELFGAGGGGESKADRKTATKDGDIGACRTSSSGAAAPPEDCQAILRLDLAPLKEHREQDVEGAPADASQAASHAGAPPPRAGAAAGAHVPNLHPAPPPPPRGGTASAAAASPPATATEDETPTCAPGLKWNGSKCKAQ